ncbi:2-oxoglutarate dehydrogenase E2 component [Desulfacinum infernum DSM 9756]|jgi:2-oxoglutarate dehydrogenase E2 component (dihydrolipoamide succinyltransferase)|uniref:Dihydrolipoyllysine-residue succinyltransferase component of 2-oxoglutarate dehydrogenase complex n=1 Tax=Desulfacinum infernum DSM 9756 TaxID=1121391 RepID=A0A1M4ZX83_9BACT|nr:2-oxoglutarate dehydrogenase complex dihydrolipoyllysine-residue succinyltransferase [Desulfacinum infernum]SHF22352.1 2-oxoglutarate dehydrogenase E2 component [Desulfacinum infernum DSM 9756]
MKQDIVIPDVGESVQEAVLAEWFVKPGERVTKGTVLFVLETDKVTLEVAAESDGVVEILVEAGETVTVGTVVGRIDTEAASEAVPEKGAEASVVPASVGEEPEEGETLAAEVARVVAPKGPEEAEAVPSPEVPAEAPPSAGAAEMPQVFPSVARLAAEKGIDLSRVAGTGPYGRVTRGDLLLFLESQTEEPTPKEVPVPQAPSPAPTAPPHAPPKPESPRDESPETIRKPMSRIRKRIAERLVHAKQTTAMLTTFNEVDMGRVMDFRRRFKESFREKYGVSLGIMSFFVKACVAALQEIPEVNAFIDGDDIVYNRHVHMGVAIGAERGLVVPVIRYADRLGFAEIEQAIVDFVKKVRENRLQLSDLEGGTFTISNGGVYGSLLSTPILNPPQSGILGLHKIEDRPVVVDGQVVVRPMMYVALSYDHRIIDGREAVTFLKRIKEFIEDPERLLVGV